MRLFPFYNLWRPLSIFYIDPFLCRPPKILANSKFGFICFIIFKVLPNLPVNLWFFTVLPVNLKVGKSSTFIHTNRGLYYVTIVVLILFAIFQCFLVRQCVSQKFSDFWLSRNSGNPEFRRSKIFRYQTPVSESKTFPKNTRKFSRK